MFSSIAPPARKTILILGAGPHQLQAIQHAVARGFYIITADNRPENPGHHISHQQLFCSTNDERSLLELTSDLEIHGVATFASDISTPSASLLAHRMGLPGAPRLAVQTLTNKIAFRSCQRRHGLRSPRFAAVESEEVLEDRVSGLVAPVVFKPADSSGSKGITRVTTLSRQHCQSAYQKARSWSRCGEVCVEEWVDGTEVGGDAFLVNGKVAVGVVTNKFLEKWVPIGHSIPSSLSSITQKAILDEVLSNCKAAGYLEGPCNFDVMLTSAGPTVLEIGARTGGNGIVPLILRATGVNLYDATLSFSLGEPAKLPAEVYYERPCGSLILRSKRAGILEHFTRMDELVRLVPEIFEVMIDYQPGEHVPSFQHSGHRIGHVFFDLGRIEDYPLVVDKVLAALRLRVIPA